MPIRESSAAAANTLGFCTSVFGHRDALTPAKLNDLANWGVDTIEISALQDQHISVFDRESIAGLLAAVRRQRLSVWSIHAPFCGLAMDDPDTRAAAVRRLIQTIAVAGRFGAACVVVHPGRDIPVRSPRREAQWLFEGLRAAATALPRGMKLALEVMGPHSGGSTLPEMQRAMRQFSSPQIGVCFDTGHAHLHSVDVLDFIRGLAGRIATVHLHDNHGDRDAHAMPGDGDLPWRAILRTFREAGYHGPWISEAGSPGQSPRKLVGAFKRQMREFLRDV